MPLTREKRYQLLRLLDVEYQSLNQRHLENAPKNNTIPVGGGDWMDTFFRMEAIRGCMGALREGKSLGDAIAEGKAVSEIAVKIWNKKREWQVHHHTETAFSFLSRLMHRLRKSV